MAREVIIRMTDDLDRSKLADEPIEFTFEGVTYHVDLTFEHADEFRAALEPYMNAAHERTRVKGVGSGKSHPSPEGESKEMRNKIRRWAKKQGMPVPERGIISRDIRAAYLAANGGPVVTGELPPLEPAAGQLAVAQRPWNAPDDPHAVNSAGVSHAMREWARANGYEIRGGYVKAEIRQAYATAMAESQGRHPASQQLALNGASHA